MQVTGGPRTTGVIKKLNGQKLGGRYRRNLQVENSGKKGRVVSHMERKQEVKYGREVI